MAIIYNYPLNSILLAEDMLIGTSTNIVNGQPKNATKNFSIADLTGFIKQNVSLNDVLLAGNTSLLDAKVGGLYLYDTPVADYGNIVLNQNRFSFNTVTHGEVFRAQRDMFSSFSSSGYRGSFEVSSITANRVWDFPNKSGTVALLSDAPTLQEVTDAGAITTDQITVGGIISGNLYSDGYTFGISDNYDANYNLYYMPYSGLQITDTVNYIYLNQDASIGFQTAVGDGNLRSDLLTGTRSWQFPDASGILALTSNIGTWGALNYPTWTTGTPFVKMTAAGTFALDTTSYYPYPTGTISQYIRGDGTFATFPSMTIPTLQQVTTAGNTTTDGIVAQNTSGTVATQVGHGFCALFNALTGQITTISADSDLIFQNGANILYLKSPVTISGTNTQTLQNATGTIALLSDVGVTSVTATSPITSSGGTTPVISTSMATNKLIGRSTAGTGVMEEITIGTGLTLSGGILNGSATGVTSVGLTMPSAFTVTNSPITSSGDIAVIGAGLVSQYVRGDGTLANFPNSTGGGSSVNYYLNGSVSQGTFGGNTYYQMSKTPILGGGTNFIRTNGAGNGYIASFITDAGDPSFLNIPAGNWNLEFYFNASSGGGSPSFYAELYKVSATNVFTLIASDSLNPEGITNGTTVDQYFTSIPVPQTSLLVTDRLAVRIFVNTGGRTITLHTENGNLSEVLTTFTTGLTALNGLTQQVQNLTVGTSGTDFAISSATDTHTFNLPTASAINRGALSSADWTTFNNKQNALSYTPYRFTAPSQIVHTGVVTETILQTILIPANTFSNGDFIMFSALVSKLANLGNTTHNLKINTTNTLVGATSITLLGFNTVNFSMKFKREMIVNSGNIYVLNVSAATTNDQVTNATASVINSYTYNLSANLYFFVTCTLTNILDTITYRGINFYKQ